MTVLRLDFWNRTWQTVGFNTDLGRGRVRWFGNKTVKTVGCAFRKHFTWYAYWADKTTSTLVFQTRDIRLPIDSSHQCELDDDGSYRTFTISKNGSPVWSHRYKKSILADGIFDDLDDEMDDFFLFLSNQWDDDEWRSLMIGRSQTD